MSDPTRSFTLVDATKLAILDFFLLTAAYLLPAFSHWLSFPLYQCDPMRIILLSGLLISCNKKNAYVMALTLPLFSFLLTAHPVFPKNIAIIIELMANVALFDFLSKRLKSTFGAMFIAIVASKVLYYGLKAVLLAVGVLQTNFIDTQIGTQIIVAAVLAGAFGLQNHLTSNKQ